MTKEQSRVIAYINRNASTRPVSIPTPPFAIIAPRDYPLPRYNDDRYADDRYDDGM